jgi:hypothetical protein
VSLRRPYPTCVFRWERSERTRRRETQTDREDPVARNAVSVHHKSNTFDNYPKYN